VVRIPVYIGVFWYFLLRYDINFTAYPISSNLEIKG